MPKRKQCNTKFKTSLNILEKCKHTLMHNPDEFIFGTFFLNVNNNNVILMGERKDNRQLDKVALLHDIPCIKNIKYYIEKGIIDKESYIAKYILDNYDINL